MKRAVAMLLCLAAPAAFADPVRDLAAIQTMVKERCQLCHMDEDDSAPSIGTVKKLEAAAIAEKLIDGTMSPMVPDLDVKTKREIAVFLTGKPLPASGGEPDVTLPQ